MKDRISWEEYFIGIVKLISQRSTCLRRKVGAIIVKDNHLVSSGYNGAPKNIKHCSERGCFRIENNIASGTHAEKCFAIHAEQNAIIQATKFGINIEGATLYCTTHPCIICSKMIIQAGIKK
jgi:dCMP deaminase